MTAEPLNVTMVAITKTVRFKITGDLNVDSGVRLRQALSVVPEEADLVLDVSDVGNIDSYGMWVLATDASRRANGGGSLRLENPSTRLRTLLEQSGTTELLAPVPTHRNGSTHPLLSKALDEAGEARSAPRAASDVANAHLPRAEG